MKKLWDHGAFTATEWDTKDQKARFLNCLADFILNDFPKSKFPSWLYKRLSMCFGFIAHYDIHGFYAEYFETTTDKLRFLEQILSWPCHGDPKFTYSDAERTFRAWLMEENILQKTHKRWMQEADEAYKKLRAERAE